MAIRRRARGVRRRGRRRNGTGTRKRGGLKLTKLVNRAISNRFKQDYTNQSSGGFTLVAPIGRSLTLVAPECLLPTNDLYDCFARAVTGVAGQAPTAAQSTESFILNHSAIEYNIHNNDKNLCVLEAYYFKPRRDCPNITALTNINALITDGWRASGLTQVASGQTPGYSETLTISPFMSPNFCRWFKVYHVKKLTIPSGAMVRLGLKWTRKSGRTINGSMLLPDQDSLTNAGLATAFYKDFFKGIVFKVYGTPTHDSTTSTNVAEGKTEFDVVWSKKTVYSKLPQQGSKNYDNTSTFAVVSTEQFAGPSSIQTE